MAHGTPIYHVCTTCRKYILNPRFSKTPICKCGKEARQIQRNDLKELAKCGLFEDLSINLLKWIKF